MSTEEHLAELGEAARRASSIVTEHINSMVDGAQRQADRIREDAEIEAERTRRDAVESARRVLEHLAALEQPLGQLVMSLQAEVDRVAGELGSGGYVDAHASALPEAPPHEEAPPPEEEAPEEEAPEPDTAEDEALAEPDIEDAQEVEEPEPEPTAAEPEDSAPAEEAKPRRGLLRRLGRSRNKTFISTQGYCAVCQRAFMAGSEDNLRLSGWLVSGEVGLCPDCQSEGWQLPEGAQLPFRRGG